MDCRDVEANRARLPFDICVFLRHPSIKTKQITVLQQESSCSIDLNLVVNFEIKKTRGFGVGFGNACR